MIITTALVLASLAADGVEMKFVPEGAVAKSGGYSPMRAAFAPDAPAGVKKKPDGATGFGEMKFGTRSVLFAIGDGKIWVDANNNGDLTDDPAAEWAPRQQQGSTSTMYMGAAKVDIGKGTPVKVNFYRFDPNDANRAALKSTLLYYGDFGYEITLNLGGKNYSSFIASEPNANTRLSVDRDGNGKNSFFYEAVQVGKPFNFTGTTYVLNYNAGKLSLDKAANQLPMSPMPPQLEVGKKSLTFTAKATDGTDIKFPETYKGKIVMLDFWATWCGPCIAELPNVTKAYNQYHDKGFEILGISFDQENMAEKVAAFTKERNMPWRQIYEGKFWNTSLGEKFDVAAIPFVLLVDGDTGEILAMGSQMRGEAIFGTIEKALQKKGLSK